MDFSSLVDSIRQVHEECAAQASKEVNVSLTLRNWLIGFHIAEYELRGEDRSHYGEGLLKSLTLRLKQEGMNRVEERELRRYRSFYQTYPQIRESLTPDFANFLPSKDLHTDPQIQGALNPDLGSETSQILQTPSAESESTAPNRESLSPEFHNLLPRNDLSEGAEIWQSATAKLETDGMTMI